MVVYLDTNAYIAANYRFTEGNFAALSKCLNDELVRLIYNEVSLRRVIYLLRPPATLSPTYEQGQVRDAMITHLPLFSCQQKALHHTGHTPFRCQRSQKV